MPWEGTRPVGQRHFAAPRFMSAPANSQVPWPALVRAVESSLYFGRLAQRDDRANRGTGRRRTLLGLRGYKGRRSTEPLSTIFHPARCVVRTPPTPTGRSPGRGGPSEETARSDATPSDGKVPGSFGHIQDAEGAGTEGELIPAPLRHMPRPPSGTVRGREDVVHRLGYTQRLDLSTGVDITTARCLEQKSRASSSVVQPLTQARCWMMSSTGGNNRSIGLDTMREFQHPPKSQRIAPRRKVTIQP